MDYNRLSFNKIVKKQIPQRRMLFMVYFGVSFIFIIISLIFLTQLYVIIGVLSFLVLLFFYRSGSIYATYMTMGTTYFLIKQSEGGSNKEIIIKSILHREKSFPIPNSEQHMFAVIDFLESFVTKDFTIYSHDHLLIYITSLAIWMNENNAADNPFFREFAKQQVFELEMLLRQ